MSEIWTNWRKRAARLKDAALNADYFPALEELRQHIDELERIPIAREAGPGVVALTLKDLEDLQGVLVAARKLKADIEAIKSFHRTFGKFPEVVNFNE